jgi:hypothetical protein
MKRRVTALGICGAICLAGRAVLAWGSFGHEEVAAAAYDQLTQPTRNKVNKLLKLNPQYADWVKGVAAKDRTRVAFVKAATWARLDQKAGCARVQGRRHRQRRPATARS